MRIVEIVAAESELLALAANNAVASLCWCDPPQQLNNRDGARLCGAGQLQLPTVYKGKGLTGKGVRIGLWDSNVGEHVDYGARIQRLEYEISIASTGAHGMHTAGTILGSGLLDERARGIAPEARIWASNFNEESNGKIPEQEMLDLYDAEHISLTSNSYGMQMFQLATCTNSFLQRATSWSQPLSVTSSTLSSTKYVISTWTNHTLSIARDFGIAPLQQLLSLGETG